jgi:RNA polymerase sigma-70 factor (ECF subfamily)
MDSKIADPDVTALPGSEQLMPQRVSQAVACAQLGDRGALGFLYALYADDVQCYVRSIVHDHHEAEEVTQQVFAKLIHVIGKYAEGDVPFFVWILRLARNASVDYLDQQRSTPVEEVRTSEQSEAFVLRDAVALSPEIDTRTGRTAGSVYGLHHRGGRALAAELTSRGAALATAASLCLQADLSRVGAHEAMSG